VYANRDAEKIGVLKKKIPKIEKLKYDVRFVLDYETTLIEDADKKQKV